MLDAIEQVLVKKKKKFIRIDGNTSSDQRKFFVDKFQYDDNYECAILSITAANAGITLTAAKLVLFAELHWNPSVSIRCNVIIYIINISIIDFKPSRESCTQDRSRRKGNS